MIVHPAKTQISLGIHPVWSESSLSAWRKLGSLATISNPLNAQRRLWSDWADAQTDLSLRWAQSHFVGFIMRRLILCNMLMATTVIWALWTDTSGICSKVKTFKIGMVCYKATPSTEIISSPYFIPAKPNVLESFDTILTINDPVVFSYSLKWDCNVVFKDKIFKRQKSFFCNLGKKRNNLWQRIRQIDHFKCYEPQINVCVSSNVILFTFNL